MKLNDRKLLSFIAAFIFISLGAVSIIRHLSLSSCAFDAGIFDQAIWNTTRGDILFSSLKNNMSLLGDHFEPVLFLIVPFYWLWPNCLVLFILQALLLSLAIIPLYRIAKQVLNQRLLIFAFIISYALSRPLRGVAYSDFHPECFLLPLLFLAYYFLLQRKNMLLAAVVLILLLCKEDTGVLISALGIFAGLKKRYLCGSVLFVTGVASVVITTKLIIPFFNPAHQFDYMNRLPFGPTYQDNLAAVMDNPLILGRLFWSKERIEYILKLLGPTGFLSLLSPAHYILFGAAIIKNLLPTNINFSGWYNITSHYTASVIPFVYISAVYGASVLMKRFSPKITAGLLSFFIILCSVLFYGKGDVAKFNRFLQSMRKVQALSKIGYLKRIPASASVSANLNLVPHLSHRKYVFEWNPSSRTSYITEYVVLDLDLMDYLLEAERARIGEYLQEIAARGYRQVFASPNKRFLIYHNPGIDQTLVQNVFLTKERNSRQFTLLSDF